MHIYEFKRITYTLLYARIHIIINIYKLHVQLLTPIFCTVKLYTTLQCMYRLPETISQIQYRYEYV